MLTEEQYAKTTDILLYRAIGNVYDLIFKEIPDQVECWVLLSVREKRVFSITTEQEGGSNADEIRT